MSYRCPGQFSQKIEAKVVECPNCGHLVEIFSDELRVLCPNCRKPVYQEAMPSCIDWCPAAEKCLGSERWRQIQEAREELNRLRSEGARLSPTEALKREHRLIERLLRVLERASRRLEGGEQVPPELFKKSLEFIRTFADRCHHGKEEELLFPLLERRGVPKEGGPIGVMLSEHEEGRGLVRGLAEAISSEAREKIIQSARSYIQLLSQHIQKEDDVLFPMADHLLSESEQRELLERFEGIERERIGEGVHERFEQLILELEGLVEGGGR